MLVKGNNLQKKTIRNILLIQLGDIGDVVLSLPAIRALGALEMTTLPLLELLTN